MKVLMMVALLLNLSEGKLLINAYKPVPRHGLSNGVVCV